MRHFILKLFITLSLALSLPVMSAPAVNWSHQSPARMTVGQLENPEDLPIIGTHCAGNRVIAVGEYGSVMLFDPKADKARQATQVPTRASLTAVSFIDQRHGWAVGHQGVILQTRDGGDTWSLLQADAKTEALFSVLFLDEDKGLAGGRFATLIRTQDGGQNWEPLSISDDPDAEEAHLFDLFSDGKGKIYAASEYGAVLVTADEGNSWRALETGFGGSLWAGIADSNGTIVTVGMVGAIYRSGDFGESWNAIEVDSNASFTDVVRLMNGDIVAVGMNGVVATSHDDGQSFSVEQRTDRAGLTAVGCGNDNKPVLFSKAGLVR